VRFISVCALFALAVGVFTVPVGLILGGSLGSNPQWVPIFCVEDQP